MRASVVWLLLCACAGPALVATTAYAQVEAEFADEFDARPEAPAEPRAPAPTPAPAVAPVPEAAAVAEPATTTSVVTVSAEVAAEPALAEPTSDPAEERFRTHNTWLGPVGGVHVVDAGSGAPGTFRLQLGVDFFSSSDYLVTGDENDWIGGTLSLSWTLGEFIELFGAVVNHANSNTEEDPELMQVLGDALLGIKAFERPLDWLALGGDFRLVVLNSVGDIGPVLGGTSFGFRGLASIDLRRVDRPLPLLARLSLDYFFDNSAVLVEDVEDARYEALGAARRDRPDEDRHLLRRPERFALGINRLDMFSLGTGVEVPLELDRDFYLHPLLEWTLGIPVNRQGYDCLAVPTDAGTGDPDGCLDQEGLGAMPSTLTLAFRLLPPVRGLSFALGIDIATTGASTFVRELAPNKPYDVLVTLSYAVDPHPPARETEAVREVVREPPPKPRVVGRVVEKGSDTPIAHAIVSYPGREFTSQQADAEGRFTSYGLDPGEARFEVSHDDYETGTCVAELPATLPPPALVELRCELAHEPGGSLRGEVVGREGVPVAGAKVQMNGPETHALVTDAGGVFALASLAPGEYATQVEADGYLVARAAVFVTAGLTAAPRIELEPKAEVSKVELTDKEVRIREQIHFRTASAEILADSDALLREIADVLLRNPQVRGIEIQGHTDSTGKPDFNLRLSQARAESVQRRLVEAGVAAARLSAKGYGDSEPLVPNITAKGRAKNRRVQFILTGRD